MNQITNIPVDRDIWRKFIFIIQLFRSIWHERTLASAFDRVADLALVFGAEAAAAAWGDLHVGRHEAAERTNIFVINNQFVVGAIVAAFGAVIGFGLTV